MSTVSWPRPIVGGHVKILIRILMNLQEIAEIRRTCDFLHIPQILLQPDMSTVCVPRPTVGGHVRILVKSLPNVQEIAEIRGSRDLQHKP